MFLIFFSNSGSDLIAEILLSEEYKTVHQFIDYSESDSSEDDNVMIFRIGRGATCGSKHTNFLP